MTTTLTSSTPASTFNQLLHVDNGLDATEKTVLGGTGTPSAMKLSTGSASVDNIRLDGNTISTLDTNGNLTLAPNGTGSVAMSKVAITGGTISGITDLPIADGGTGASNASDARTNLGLGTMATQASSAVSITGGTITGVTMPFSSLNNIPHGSFYDAGTANQTGSTTDRTAVKWATSAVTGYGVSVVSNSRITLAAAGTYRFNASLQLNNPEAADHDVTVWFAKNGTNIASSAAMVTVPKTGDGGTYLLAYEIFETVAANDYIEMYWYPEHANLRLFYKAAVAANPGVTPAIPVIPPAIVVVQRVA